MKRAPAEQTPARTAINALQDSLAKQAVLAVICLPGGGIDCGRVSGINRQRADSQGDLRIREGRPGRRRAHCVAGLPYAATGGAGVHHRTVGRVDRKRRHPAGVLPFGTGVGGDRLRPEFGPGAAEHRRGRRAGGTLRGHLRRGRGSPPGKLLVTDHVPVPERRWGRRVRRRNGRSPRGSRCQRLRREAKHQRGGQTQ